MLANLLTMTKPLVHQLMSEAFYLPRSCREANQVDHIDETA